MFEDDVSILHPEVLLHEQVEVFHFTLITGWLAILEFGKREPVPDVGVGISESIGVRERHVVYATGYKAIEDEKDRILVGLLPGTRSRFSHHIVKNELAIKHCA